MTYQCTQERFLADVKDHVVEVLRDDGIYRHIRFSKPGTMIMHFDLITWPGYLCYCGDMGNYVFSRTRDMFEFFRHDRDYHKSQGRQLFINLGYWSEKLQSIDGTRNHAAVMEHDEESFKRAVNEYRLSWMREGGLNKEQRRELWDAVDEEVLEYAGDSHRGPIAAHDFSHYINGESFCFEDFFEHNLTDYTFRFVWCCYALAWGIEQYDALSIEVAA